MTARAPTTLERSALLARRFNSFSQRLIGGYGGEEMALRLSRVIGPGDAAYMTLLCNFEAGEDGARPQPSDSIRLAEAHAGMFERAGFGPGEVRALFGEALKSSGLSLPEDAARCAATLKRKKGAAFARVLEGR